jgi:hypothetical protein
MPVVKRNVYVIPAVARLRISRPPVFRSANEARRLQRTVMISTTMLYEQLFRMVASRQRPTFAQHAQYQISSPRREPVLEGVPANDMNHSVDVLIQEFRHFRQSIARQSRQQILVVSIAGRKTLNREQNHEHRVALQRNVRQ